jgi:hypothetical protein
VSDGDGLLIMINDACLDLCENIALGYDVLALLRAYAQALRQHLQRVVIARHLHRNETQANSGQLFSRKSRWGAPCASQA